MMKTATMMKTFGTLALLVVAACGTTDEDVADAMLAEYGEHVDRIDAATAAYVIAAAGAENLNAIAVAQSIYLAELGPELDELDHVLEGFRQCEMMNDAAERMAMAVTSVEAMRQGVQALAEAHTAHTDIAQCQQLAEEHDDEMAGDVSDLMNHGTAWQGNMSCMSHGGGAHQPGDQHP